MVLKEVPSSKGVKNVLIFKLELGFFLNILLNLFRILRRQTRLPYIGNLRIFDTFECLEVLFENFRDFLPGPSTEKKFFTLFRFNHDPGHVVVIC